MSQEDKEKMKDVDACLGRDARALKIYTYPDASKIFSGSKIPEAFWKDAV